jgi:heptosyltransferase-1
MGDILHALPAVTALRQAHPGWIIDWVIEPQWRALLAAERNPKDNGSVTGHDFSRAASAPELGWALAPEGSLPEPSPVSLFSAASSSELAYRPNPAQPLVDHIHIAPTKAWRKAPLTCNTLREIKTLRRTLRAANYDAVIDLQGAIRSAVVARLAGCRRVIGEAEPRERPARRLFTQTVATRGAHVIEQDLELVSSIAGDDLKPVAPWLPADPAAEAWAGALLPPNSPPAVLINPGAGWGAKRWPPERYGEVAAELIRRGYRVFANAGPGEESLVDAIQQAAAGDAVIPLACTLAQLIAITRRVALVIAGDTGPLHLACALGRPVVGIYGPTDPSRNGPFGTSFKVLRSPESRRDHTRNAAPEPGLLTIQPADVLRAAEELLTPENAR